MSNRVFNLQYRINCLHVLRVVCRIVYRMSRIEQHVCVLCLLFTHSQGQPFIRFVSLSHCTILRYYRPLATISAPVVSCFMRYVSCRVYGVTNIMNVIYRVSCPVSCVMFVVSRVVCHRLCTQYNVLHILYGAAICSLRSVNASLIIRNSQRPPSRLAINL